jgi:hypothetical protein
MSAPVASKFAEALKPPHGWRSLIWELAIVTIGVFIALAAQQWAEDRAWKGRAQVATESIRREIAAQYRYAVEWRSVEPCVLAQIDTLERRVMASGAVLDPAPVYSEPGFAAYAVRMPNRTYEDGAWQTAVSDGTVPYLRSSLRTELNPAYTVNEQLAALNSQNNSAYQRLLSLTRSITLDPVVRFSLLQELDELHGRVELMGLLSGQSIGHWEEAGIAPALSTAEQYVTSSGTYRFCHAHGLPVRSIAEASAAIPI